jgi:hypothetical protein
MLKIDESALKSVHSKVPLLLTSIFNLFLKTFVLEQPQEVHRERQKSKC